jgi:hypothetical protein
LRDNNSSMWTFKSSFDTPDDFSNLISSPLDLIKSSIDVDDVDDDDDDDDDDDANDVKQRPRLAHSLTIQSVFLIVFIACIAFRCSRYIGNLYMGNVK